MTLKFSQYLFFELLLLLTQWKSLVESRKRIQREKKKEAIRHNLLNTSKRGLAKQNLFTFRFSTHEAPIEIKRVSIDRSIGARTRLSTPRIAVNEGFTVDFRKIDSERAHCLLSSPSHPRPISFPLVHPRAAQRRNRPPAKRECISRLLSFPSISYRKEKEYSPRMLAYVSTVSSRCPRRLWLTRANRVNVHNSVSRFTAHYRFHSP